jgi:hypothetical protein
MSVSSMTNVAFSRRKDVAPINEAPTSVDEIAAAKADKPGTQSIGTSTLAAIAAYIPTEVLTVYVAVVAALSPGAGAAVPASAGWIAFLIFLVFTPLVVWLVSAGKVRRAGKAAPVALNQWPKWEMFAATLAYSAWAFALPQTPFSEFGWYSAAIAAVGVLVATTALGLVAPVAAQSLEP